MPRKPLQPGELGTPTLRKITRNTAGKPVADPNGKEWEGAIRIGQHSGAPKLVRRTGTTRQQALENTLHAAQQHLTVAITPQLQHTTLNTLWETHQQTPAWAKLAPNTQSAIATAIRAAQHLSPRLWNTPLSENIPRRVWQQYLDDLTTQHGTATAKTTRTTLRKILTPHTDTYDLTPLNQCAIQPGILVRPRAHLELDRVFTPDEFTQLREHLNAYRNSSRPRAKVARALLFNTFAGMRISEVGALTWDDFAPDRTTVTGYSSKTRKHYPTKTLPPWAVRLVQEQNPRSPHPFPLVNNSVSPTARSLLNEAGFPWASTHTIRRTVGSIIFDQYGARTAAAWLGHANVATTLSHYVKTQDELTDIHPNF